MTKSDSNTVRIDEDLLKRIAVILKHRTLRIKYASRKQFVNFAVVELLDVEEKKANL